MALNPNTPSQPWYKQAEPHNEVFAVLKSLSDNQGLRTTNNLRYARLYGNLDIVGLSPVDYFRTGNPGPALQGSRLTWNIIKSMVDTVTSKIAKNRPRPVFLTNAGDWTLQQKAKKMTRFIQGVFYETEAYAKGALMFRNGAVFGDGFLKIYEKDGRIAIDQVISEEIIVDATESVYGKPRSMFQVRNIDRSVLLDLCDAGHFTGDQDKLRACIMACDPIRPAYTGGATLTSDLIQVVEGWHLKSGKGAKDGKHTLAIRNCTLVAEEYDRAVFPFVKLPWTPPLVGFYGMGLAEELIGIQLEINKLLRQIQLSHHLLSTPKIFIESTSDVVSAHMNNEIGAIIKFRGVAPTIHSFQTVHPEIYQHLERLYMRAYEIAGISQLAAQAKKPAGLDSGKALREFSEIESERFAITQQRWEEMYVEIAQHCIELGRDIVKSGASYKVQCPNKRFTEELDLKDVLVDESSYVMQCFPTNFLPATPAGRIQSVQELMNMGLLTQETARSLLDFPDLEGAMDLLNATYDDAMLHIENIIVYGKYTEPDPFSNLELLKNTCQAAYLKAKGDKVPEDRLEMLRRTVLSCVRMQASTAASSPAQAAAATAQPIDASGAPAPMQAPPVPVVG
jgi:hypothetical protein